MGSIEFVILIAIFLSSFFILVYLVPKGFIFLLKDMKLRRSDPLGYKQQKWKSKQSYQFDELRRIHKKHYGY